MKSTRWRKVFKVTKPHAVKLMEEAKKDNSLSTTTLQNYADIVSRNRREFYPPNWICDLEEDYLYPQRNTN